LNAQKHAHNRNEQMGNLKRPYIHLPLWWIGMLLMAIGETGNFLAYAYAPATLVAPLGSVSVVCNALLSSLVLREQISFKNKAGCLLAIIGSCFVVRFAPTSDHQLNMSRLADYMTDPVFLTFLFLIVIGFVYLYRLPLRVQQSNVIVYVLMCSLMGAITVSCTKGLSTALILTVSGSSHSQFSSLLPWILLMVICGTMVVQIKYLNLAMISFGASEVVPVYYVTFTFCSVMAGIVLFKEYHETSALHAFLFILGVAITFGGVYLITSGMRASGGEYAPGVDGESDALMTEEITLDDEDGEFEDPLGTRLSMMRV
jgi:drug/metabolite transporter (DMT)-like permease